MSLNFLTEVTTFWQENMLLKHLYIPLPGEGFCPRRQPWASNWIGGTHTWFYITFNFNFYFNFNFIFNFIVFIVCQAYTLGVKEEDGNLIVNIVADTYFGAR